MNKPDNISAEQWEKIQQAIEAGRKIEAIKLIREETGLGLKEAKDMADALDTDARQSFSGKRATGETDKSGCAAVLAVAVGPAVLMLLWCVAG